MDIEKSKTSRNPMSNVEKGALNKPLFSFLINKIVYQEQVFCSILFYKTRTKREKQTANLGYN